MKRKSKRLEIQRETVRQLNRLGDVRGAAVNTTGPECTGQSVDPSKCDLCPDSGTGSCNGTDCCPHTRQGSCNWC